MTSRRALTACRSIDAGAKRCDLRSIARAALEARRERDDYFFAKHGRLRSAVNRQDGVA